MIAFSIWTIHVYRYWIFYAITFLLAYVFLKYRAHKFISDKHPKIKEIFQNKTEDLLLYSILWVLVWGRVGHILIYDLSYYMSDPKQILEIWNGWMSFIWWIIWVVIAMVIFQRKEKLWKQELLIILDTILTIVPFGIAIGRIWNFLNQELYWIVVPSRIYVYTNISNILTKSHFFHIYSQIDNNLRINTNFLSSLFEWIVLLGITNYIFYKKKNRKAGVLSCVFLIYYSFIRFLLEYVRYDSQSEFVLFFTKSQWFFMGFIIIWLIIFIRISKSNNHTSL